MRRFVFGSVSSFALSAAIFGELLMAIYCMPTHCGGRANRG